MKCTSCGAEIPEGTNFCQTCGAPVVEGIVTSNNTSSDTVVHTTKPANSTPVLIWGIVGLAFSCTFYLSFLGIIFSAIAKGKVNTYLMQNGLLTGKAKTGRILATIGLYLGIVLTILLVIFVVILADL